LSRLVLSVNIRIWSVAMYFQECQNFAQMADYQSTFRQCLCILFGKYIFVLRKAGIRCTESEFTYHLSLCSGKCQIMQRSLCPLNTCLFINYSVSFGVSEHSSVASNYRIKFHYDFERIREEFSVAHFKAVSCYLSTCRKI